MIDTTIFDALCEASQLSFSESEKEKMILNLNSLVEFTDSVRNFDDVYDDTKDTESVSFNDLRDDVCLPSYTPEKLLANTESLFECYIIPKIME